MERIKGFNLPFDISRLKRRADLITQDGPLLSLYYNNNGDYYLFYWLDCDSKANRWMILRVDTKTIYEYLSGEKSLLQVIENPSDNFVWITDIGSVGTQIYTQALPASSIPRDYFPKADSFFEFEHKEELLNEVTTDIVEIDIPKSDKSLFAALMSKMGWRLSPRNIHRIVDKVAF